MSDTNTKITIFLAVVAALVGFHLWLGSKTADIAEKKGHPRPFGFLLGFYFSVIGYLILRRMAPNEEELQYRADKAREEEIAELEGRKETPPPPFVYAYSTAGKRPSFIAAYALMAPVLALTLFLNYRPEDPNVKSADLNLIPRADINGWKYRGEPMPDPNVEKQVQADATTMRYYESPTGQLVQVYIVYRKYGRREFNHNPDNCFPAGGFVLQKRDVTMMPWAGGEAPAVHMVFDGSKVQHRDGVGVPETTVSYLFASGKRTEYVFLKQQMWMALERIVPNKNGWTLIRLTTQRVTTDADALAAQKEFMKVYGPQIQQAITTDTQNDTAANFPQTPPGTAVAAR